MPKPIAGEDGLNEHEWNHRAVFRILQTPGNTEQSPKTHECQPIGAEGSRAKKEII